MLVRRFSFLISSSLLMITAMSCDDDDDGGGGTIDFDASAGGTPGTAGHAGSGGRAGTAGQGGATGGATVQDAGGDDLLDAGDSGLIDPTPDSGYLVDGGIDGGALYDPCSGGIALPLESTYVAPGLCVRAVATSQGRLRQI